MAARHTGHVPISWAAAFVAVACTAASSPAGAVVRYCKAPIVVEGHAPESEQAARRVTLDKWQGEARNLGEAWASWRLATPRAIQCARADGGGYTCRAVASPCAIAQNPDRLPRSGGDRI